MVELREWLRADIPKVKKFTDVAIGTDYYSLSELEDNFKRAEKNGVMCSFVLVDGDEILGLRLSYPPGQWLKGKGSKLRSDLWKVSIEDAGYFQSLFISEKLRGQGWGPKLSQAAIANLRRVGAKAIVTHSWVQSPNDSSGRYLRQLGFASVAMHKEYWKDVDYICTYDGKPCLCTAEEMILYL